MLSLSSSTSVLLQWFFPIPSSCSCRIEYHLKQDYTAVAAIASARAHWQRPDSFCHQSHEAAMADSAKEGQTPSTSTAPSNEMPAVLIIGGLGTPSHAIASFLQPNSPQHTNPPQQATSAASSRCTSTAPTSPPRSASSTKSFPNSRASPPNSPPPAPNPTSCRQTPAAKPLSNEYLPSPQAVTSLTSSIAEGKHAILKTHPSILPALQASRQP